MILVILLWVLIYAYIAFSLQVIANKTNIEREWLAWIPIANIYLTCKIARKPGWWTLLCLIPFVGIFILVIIWMRIVEILNRKSWLGILVLIPLVNFILMGYLAFSKNVKMESNI